MVRVDVKRTAFSRDTGASMQATRDRECLPQYLMLRSMPKQTKKDRSSNTD